MKIMNWDEFTSLPAGTIFSYWKPCVVDGLYRKGETLLHDGVPGDFVLTDLLHSVFDGEGEDIYKPQLHNCGSREGHYDHSQKYCVFDAADIEKMHKMLDNLPTEVMA